MVLRPRAAQRLLHRHRQVLLQRAARGRAALAERRRTRRPAGGRREIFQACTPLYYADEEEPLPPLVLVGIEHWTKTVPVWPALETLGVDRPLGDALYLVDSPDEAAELISCVS